MVNNGPGDDMLSDIEQVRDWDRADRRTDRDRFLCSAHGKDFHSARTAAAHTVKGEPCGSCAAA